MSASISVALLATEFRLMLLVERWRCRCCATGADIPLCVGARSGAESRIDNAPARNTGEGGQVHSTPQARRDKLPARDLTEAIYKCNTGLWHCRR